MNDDIRQTVKDALHARKLTQADVAARLGLQQPAIARMLSGTGQGAGKLPGNWARLLKLLDLELTVKQKDVS